MGNAFIKIKVYLTKTRNVRIVSRPLFLILHYSIQWSLSTHFARLRITLNYFERKSKLRINKNIRTIYH